MISRQSKGSEATCHAERLRTVRSMGRYAAMINSIQTQGFGSTFEWCRNELSQNATWTEFLRDEFKLEENLSVLAEHGILNAPRIKKVRTALERAAGKSRLPYGDLRLKNVLVDEKVRFHASSIGSIVFPTSPPNGSWPSRFTIFLSTKGKSSSRATDLGAMKSLLCRPF
jgi:hypothetical protein